MPFHKTATFTGHRSGIYCLIAGDKSLSFFSAGGDGQVVRWDLDRPDQGELVSTVDRPVFSLMHDRERRLLMIGNDDGGLHVLDLDTKRELNFFTVHRKGIFAITAIPGDRFACAGGDGSISIWRNDPVELIRQIPIDESKIRDLSVSSDGNWLAVADGEGDIRLLDTADLNEHHRVRAHDGGCTAVIFHPTKPVLISGGKDGHLRTWHSADLLPVHFVAAHAGSIYMIAFSPDGAHCATASRDKTIKIWDANTFDPLQRLDRAASGHGHSVNTLLWIGSTLITAGDDRGIIAWDQSG